MSVSGIRKVFELSQQLDNPIDLSIGKPDFDVPEKVKDEACRAIENNLNEYSLTFGLRELREKVVEKLQNKNYIDAKFDETIITSAVSGGLSVVLPVLIDMGDEVIIFDPYFVGYKQLIALYGGSVKIVPKNDDFSLNIKWLENAITNKTKVIIINTPENPTGHVWSKEELQEVANVASKNNITIVSDKIYEEFVYEKNRPHISIATMYKNTVTLGGFSKSHAMTGWRIGYLHAPQEIIEQVMKVQQYTFVCAPTPLQYATIKALDEDMNQFVKIYKLRRDKLYEGLNEKYNIVQSQGAFYFFVKYPYDGAKFVQNCIDNNLLIVPGNVFSENNKYFRISFASKEDHIDGAIEIFKSIC
jgi:aspartate aminotransferase/aminotransferase